ncbi:MAG: hypothetical protein GEU79_18095 [Acidimicrobiia bacterium]|nr:hypothetical protein [Acidimicrobiia bacterium]
MVRMSRTIKLAGLVALVLLLVSCGGSEVGSTSSSVGDQDVSSSVADQDDDVIKVTVAQAIPVFNFQGYFTAVEEGIFEAVGLEVETVEVPSTSIQQALISGSVDFANTTTVGVINGHSLGLDTIAVAKVCQGFIESVVFSADAIERTGVKPTDPLQDRIEALRGLTVGVTGLSSGTSVSLQVVLNAGGLTSSDLKEVIPVGSTDAEYAGLKAGDLDAIVVSSPVPEQIEAEGLGQTIINMAAGDLAEYAKVPALTLITSREYADENPEAVTRMAQAYLLAGELARTDPDAVKAAVRNRIAPDLDEALFETAFENNYASIPLPDDQLFTQDDFDKMFIATNLIQEFNDSPTVSGVSMDDVMVNDFLEQAQERLGDF